MIVSFFRSLAAIAVSLVVALILIIAVEAGSAVLHPFPPGVDPTDMEVCRAHVAKYPQGILALAAICWVVTVLASVWLATRLGAHRHPAHGIAIGCLLFAAAAFNIYLLPYYLWFKAVVIVGFPLAIYWGVKLGMPKRQTDVTSPSGRGRTQ